MNKKISFFFAGFLALVASNASADSLNLPNGAGLAPLGRIAIFNSPKNYSWFVPTAFSSDLSCSPTGQKRSCILRVYNRLSEIEKSALDGKPRTTSQGPVALSPLQASVVEKVQEEFSALPSGAEKEIKLQTLALNPTGMYASVAFRIEANEAIQLMARYASEGLGTFTSRITLRAEDVGEYLEIRNAAELKTALIATGNRSYRKAELDEALEKIIDELQISYQEMSESEARAVAKIELRRRFFEYSRRSYRVNSDHVEALGSRLILANETSAPYSVLCEAKLTLRAGASPELKCQEKGVVQ